LGFPFWPAEMENIAEMTFMIAWFLCTPWLSITFVSKYYCVFLLPPCSHCEGCTKLRKWAVSSRICEAPTRKTNEVYSISRGPFKNPKNFPSGFVMGAFLKSPSAYETYCTGHLRWAPRARTGRLHGCHLGVAARFALTFRRAGCGLRGSSCLLIHSAPRLWHSHFTRKKWRSFMVASTISRVNPSRGY
jgi:hypothetical protein